MPEFTVDEMIERDTGRRDVAAGVGSGEFDPTPCPLGIEHAAEKRFDGLNFDSPGKESPKQAGVVEWVLSANRVGKGWNSHAFPIAEHLPEIESIVVTAL